MTTSAQLRTIAVAALINVTDAGSRVFSPMDIATWEGEYPLLIVTAPSEDGESFGRQGAPAFTVTTTLHVNARVEHAALDNDAGAIAAQAELETLREQIKSALINYTPLMSLLQQYPFFRSHIQVGNGDDTEKHLGQLELQIGLEFVQTPADFWQPPSDQFLGVDVRFDTPQGSPQPGANIDLPI